MSDIRKLLNILSESSVGATSSGSVATVEQAAFTQSRAQTVEPPAVLEYGNWENSALTTSKKLKKTRTKARNIVKKTWGEDAPEVNESRTNQGVAEGLSDVVKGVKRLVKGKPTKGEREVHHALTAIGTAQGGGSEQEIMKHVNRYDKVKSLGQKGVAEDYQDDDEEKFVPQIYARIIPGTKSYEIIKVLDSNLGLKVGDRVSHMALTRGTFKDIPKSLDMSIKRGVAEGSDQELVNRQVSYWDQVAKEKKNKERDALKAKKAEHEKTPIGKAEKYWDKKGVAEGDPGYDKHSFVGKIRRGIEADDKGWEQTGKLIRADNEEDAKKALRKSNRYYNMIRGSNRTPDGFPKTTVEEQGVAEGQAGKPIKPGATFRFPNHWNKADVVHEFLRKKNAVVDVEYSYDTKKWTVTDSRPATEKDMEQWATINAGLPGVKEQDVAEGADTVTKIYRVSADLISPDNTEGKLTKTFRIKAISEREAVAKMSNLLKRDGYQIEDIYCMGLADDQGVAEDTAQKYSVTIDAIDHGVLGAITVSASSPDEAKRKVIEGVKKAWAKRGDELMVRRVIVKPVQGVAEGSGETPIINTCKKCGKKWKWEHYCKGSPDKKKEQGVTEGLVEAIASGNYSVGLEDIGKRVTVNGDTGGKTGYVLVSIRYSPRGLEAEIVDRKNGSTSWYNLTDISKSNDQHLGEQDMAEEQIDEVAGAQKCWPGHRKVGTQPGTGKNAGKRVNKCQKISKK